MRGCEHYTYAETLLDMAVRDVQGSTAERYHLDLAAVHATLALAGATALQSDARVEVDDAELADWQAAAGGKS